MGIPPRRFGAFFGAQTSALKHTRVSQQEKIDWVNKNAAEIRKLLIRKPPPEIIIPASTVFLRKIPHKPQVSLDYFNVMRQLKGSVSKFNRFSGVDESSTPGPSGSYWGTVEGTSAECWYYNFVRDADPYAYPRMLMPPLESIPILRDNSDLPYYSQNDVPISLPQVGNYIANLIIARTMKSETMMDFDVTSLANIYWDREVSEILASGLAEIGHTSIMDAMLDKDDAGLGRVVSSVFFKEGAKGLFSTSARATSNPDSINPYKAKNLIIWGQDFQPITDTLVGVAVVKHRADESGATATLSTFDNTLASTRQLMVVDDKNTSDRD